VVEARGWRVPIYLGGGLVALAILGVILAIAALSGREEQQANATPTPGASAAPPGSTPSPLPTITPVPTGDPALTPEPTPTTDPVDPDATPESEETPSAEDPLPTPTTDAGASSGTDVGGFTGEDGDYTVILASEKSQSDAQTIADEASGKDLPAGVLESDQYSSLNGGYWVVFTGAYATEAEAETALSSARSEYSDAYIKQIRT
jgi:septal ring-binding cell division protein DamX